MGTEGIGTETSKGDLFAGLMLGIGTGGGLLEEKAKRAATKLIKVDKIKEKRRIMRPYVYSNSFVKMNPLRQLANQKEQPPIANRTT